jgi:hypothetical protein
VAPCKPLFPLGPVAPVIDPNTNILEFVKVTNKLPAFVYTFAIDMPVLPVRPVAPPGSPIGPCGPVAPVAPSPVPTVAVASLNLLRGTVTDGCGTVAILN